MQTHEMHREVEKIGETLTSLNTILELISLFALELHFKTSHLMIIVN